MPREPDKAAAFSSPATLVENEALVFIDTVKASKNHGS
jgi:hypothetical protein